MAHLHTVDVMTRRLCKAGVNTRHWRGGGVPPPRLLSLKKIIMNPRVRLLGPAPDPAASAGLNRGVEGTGGIAEDSCSDDDARLGALVMVGRGW